MRKHVLLLLTILCAFSAVGQNKIYYATARPTDTAFTPGSWRLDSVMRATRYATSDTNKVLGTNAQGYFVLRTKGTGSATIDSNLYSTVSRLRDTSAVLRTLIGTGGTDTTSLSNRVNARVKYTDTATMLLPYARKTALADTSALLRGLIPSVAGKVNYTDTAAMLSPYYRTASATAALAAKQNNSDTLTWDATKKNLADTSAFLRSLIPAGVDTTSLSTRIDARVKYTDTAAILSPYLRKADTTAMLVPYLRSALGVKYTDTAAMLTPYLRSATAASTYQPIGSYLTSETDPLFDTKFAAKTTTDLTEGTNLYYTTTRAQSVIDADTGRGIGNLATGGSLNKVRDSLAALIGGGVVVASVAELNTGTDNAKFASSLGLEGSKYLDQDGLKLTGTTAGTSTAYTLTLTPAITAYTTGLSLWVKFHVANTGAATINVNGLGVKTLVKDISTALVANDIPINQWYTIVYDGTNFLIQDIGFGGVNLSARLLGALSDETGTGVAVFGTSPSFTTSVLGAATFSAFNTTTTNLSFAGAATTYTEGGTPTTGLTATYFGNATATGQTKTLNYGTGGASGSTTAITLGSSTSGATNNIRLNTTPVSDATGDIFYRNSSGFLQRLGIGTVGQVLTVASGLPSWATSSGGGWGLTGNTIATTDFLGSLNSFPLRFRVNNTNAGAIWGDGQYHTYLGFNAGHPNGNGLYHVGIGTNALGGMSVISVGNVGIGFNAFQNIADATYSVGIGFGAAKNNATGAYNLVLGANGDVRTTGSNMGNIGNVIWTEDNNGAATTATTPLGRVSIGTNNPNDRALLELSNAGTTKGGFKLPPFTTTERDAISWVAGDVGMMIFNTTLVKIQVWNGSAWETVTSI